MEKEIIAPGIILYKNIMPKSYELIDFINNNLQWEQGRAADSRYKKAGYENFRKVSAFLLPGDGPPSKHKKINIWNDIVEKELGRCQKDYINYYAIDILQNKKSKYQILQYSMGDRFSEHTDEIPEEPRRLSGVYYVNDNYLGGEIYFSQFDLKIKPTAGDYILFPSIWAYSHTALPVLEGTKNAIVHFIY